MSSRISLSTARCAVESRKNYHLLGKDLRSQFFSQFNLSWFQSCQGIGLLFLVLNEKLIAVNLYHPIFLLKNFLLLLFYYSWPNFPPFALLRPAHPPLPQSIPTLLSMSLGLIFMHVLCLVPSPSFHPYPPPCFPLAAVSLFHVSMLLVLFCSLVYVCSLHSFYVVFVSH